jgi:diaminopropionate ammonia-lyase
MLGASYAGYRMCQERLGTPPVWNTLAELRAWTAQLRPLTLVAATDGNHGRAVARTASLLGFGARILVPAGTVAARIDAIVGEGAAVSVVDGSYDDAVAAASRLADAEHVVIADTAWPGYEVIPGWVVEGYATMFHEIDAQLGEQGHPDPDLVLVQVGVGALAAAAVRHYRQHGRAPGLRLVGVEPESAACLLASAEAGEMVSVPGPHTSIMAGLNCGTPSPIAWPLLHDGVDLWVAIEDEWARRAMRALARVAVRAGETGAAGLGGLLALLEAPNAGEARAHLQLGTDSRVLLIVTEGVTDPAMYREIVGAPG